MDNENKNPNQIPQKPEEKISVRDKLSGFFGKLMPKKQEEAKPEKKSSNALTEIMNQSEKKQNLVSNIIKNNKPNIEDGQTEVNKVMVRDSEKQLFWGRVTSAVVLVFLLVSLGVNWVWLSPDNPVLGMIGQENIIKTEKRVTDKLASTVKKYNELSAKNEALLSQDSNAEALILKEIIGKRIAWSKVIDQIDKVVSGVSPYNPVTKKIEISQYNFAADDGKIILGGVIQNEAEDKIYNLTANVVDALEESPYFENVEYKQYSVAEEDLGSFTSPLRATFYIQDTESNENDSMNYFSTDYSKRRYRHDGYQFSTSLDEEEEN